MDDNTIEAPQYGGGKHKEYGKLGGRPSEKNAKIKRITIRFSEEQLKKLNSASQKSGLTLSEYIRQVSLFGTEALVENKELESVILIVQELRRIGNNINQIAHRLNVVHNADIQSEEFLVINELVKRIGETQEKFHILRKRKK